MVTFSANPYYFVVVVDTKIVKSKKHKSKVVKSKEYKSSKDIKTTKYWTVGPMVMENVFLLVT